MHIQLYTFCPRFNIIQKCITGDNMLTLSYIFFSGNIFNICIRFIWLNVMYIIPIFCCKILYCDCFIVPILNYHKWDLMCCFTFVCSTIIYHELISNFIVVVNSFYISVDKGSLSCLGFRPWCKCSRSGRQILGGYDWRILGPDDGGPCKRCSGKNL